MDPFTIFIFAVLFCAGLLLGRLTDHTERDKKLPRYGRSFTDYP